MRLRLRSDSAPGQVPNPFLVGLAVLGLLSEAAEERPLLCIVDDAQWLDRASAGALAFVARRLLAEEIALLFATREQGDMLAGLPELHVEPLRHRDARALLESALTVRLDERVLDRIVVETRGNPLALLELPRGLTPTQLAGGFGLPRCPCRPESRKASCDVWRRFHMMPGACCSLRPPTQRAIRRCCGGRLSGSASPSRLDTRSNRKTCSPPVREWYSVIHSFARLSTARPGAPERREVHRALAEATDPEIDPDRRAWHRAQAAAMPDEEVAAELERSAARAQARGGFAAAAAFLERAVALTPEASRRAKRALAAAQMKFQAGALDDALGLLEHG